MCNLVIQDLNKLKTTSEKIRNFSASVSNFVTFEDPWNAAIIPLTKLNGIIDSTKTFSAPMFNSRTFQGLKNKN